MTEPYKPNPLAPPHLEKQARDVAIARGENVDGTPGPSHVDQPVASDAGAAVKK